MDKCFIDFGKRIRDLKYGGYIMNPIVDLHMHIVPGIDDGSCGMEESLELLKLSIQQGVTDVFCTSHSGCITESAERYFDNLKALKDAVVSSGINIRLHKGCEVLCSKEIIDNVIYCLNSGIFSTLAESKYVLTELYPDIDLSEVLFIVDELKKNNYVPVIAHLERIHTLDGELVGALIQYGALVQVNAQSFVDEENILIKEHARQLLADKHIHFIGSDGHRINYRPPKLISGVDYILKNADINYATGILNKNAQDLINT